MSFSPKVLLLAILVSVSCVVFLSISHVDANPVSGSTQAKASGDQLLIKRSKKTYPKQYVISGNPVPRQPGKKVPLIPLGSKALRDQTSHLSLQSPLAPGKSSRTHRDKRYSPIAGSQRWSASSLQNALQQLDRNGDPRADLIENYIQGLSQANRNADLENSVSNFPYALPDQPEPDTLSDSELFFNPDAAGSQNFMRPNIQQQQVDPLRDYNRKGLPINSWDRINELAEDTPDEESDRRLLRLVKLYQTMLNAN